MDATFDVMTAALKTAGLAAALAVLNRRVAQRYSAVYRLVADGHLVNVALVDKLGEPCPAYLLGVPYDVSFCQLTIKHGLFWDGPLSLGRTPQWDPYQGLMNSYHAVPFLSTDGTVQGTICHFDTAALPLLDEDFELLRLAARALPIYLPLAPNRLWHRGEKRSTSRHLRHHQLDRHN